jgi:VWFA-related protein
VDRQRRVAPMRLRELGLCLPLLLVTQAPAPPQASTPHEPPVFGTGVSLVAVPVFVTDKAGKAVAGLTAQDFEIADGGQSVPVVAFQAVDVDVPAPPAEPGLEQAPATNEVPVAVQAAAARQFVLLFDLLFSSPHGILKAREAAARFVAESLSPTDLVAVATYRSTGLKLLTGFTSDRAHLARAIARLGLGPSPEGGRDPLDLSGAFESDASGTPEIDTGNSRLDAALQEEADSMREVLKHEYRRKVVDFLAACRELDEALSALGGRKQIVLFSAGFNDAAFQDEEQYKDQPFEVRNAMSELFGEAGRSDVVIHAIDVTGLGSARGSSLSSLSSSSAGPLTSSSWNLRSDPGRDTLTALALSTGGRIAPPTNDFLQALKEVDAVSRRYYVLAFQPADPLPKPGQARSLKVRVRRAGLKVSHRAAYVLPASSTSAGGLAQRLKAAEAVAKGLSGGPVGLRLEALPYRDSKHGPSLPAVLHVDAGALVGSGAGPNLELSVYGYAMAQGRVLDRLALSMAFDLSKQGAALGRDGLDVVTAFAVPTGTLDLRFFVRAGSSGPTGSIRQVVDVPAFAPERLALSPPMLARPLTGRLVAVGKTQGGRELELPFRLEGEPFLPDTITLHPGKPSELCVFVWPAGSHLEVTSEIEIGAQWLPLRLEGGVRVVRDSDGFDRYLLKVVALPAPAGEYTLRVTLREPGAASSAQSEARVRLED